MRSTSPIRAGAALLALAALAACSSLRPSGPVLVRTPAGVEQGVATQFGIVCLGKTARSGPCDLTVFYGDGPSVEPGKLEPLEPQLSTIDIELRAPTCEVSFTYPSPDDDLLVAVATDSEILFFPTRVARTSGNEGIAVEPPSGLPSDGSAAGAPVFRHEDRRYRLVGLLTGAQAAGGRGLAFLGPNDLVPLTMMPPRRDPRRTTPTRDDILR